MAAGVVATRLMTREALEQANRLGDKLRRGMAEVLRVAVSRVLTLKSPCLTDKKATIFWDLTTGSRFSVRGKARMASAVDDAALPSSVSLDSRLSLPARPVAECLVTWYIVEIAVAPRGT